jgi:hypothetical protein
MKISELTGTALDWAVAKCMTGGEIFQSGRVAHAVVLHVVGGTTAPYFVKDSGVVRCAFEPSTNWAQGGPIIERERVTVAKGNSIYFPQGNENGDYYEDLWIARLNPSDPWTHGPTPLVAAMRCYVASKLGDTVDLPKGLL